MIKKEYESLFPDQTFRYSFLDETYDQQYESDERLTKIISNFAIVAILIACLGLFGLASFTAEQRSKEIGIRKVLGASIPGIVVLLSKEFTKWVLIANIIGWPLVYYVMSRWLRSFAFRIDIDIWIFLVAAAVAGAIAVLTVSLQAIKASLANPAESLRYE